jgi:hypothetical protein
MDNKDLDQLEEILAELRRQRDWHAAKGNHADAMILNDRIKDLKEGRTSQMVERVMKAFESGLARYCRDVGLTSKH